MILSFYLPVFKIMNMFLSIIQQWWIRFLVFCWFSFTTTTWLQSYWPCLKTLQLLFLLRLSVAVILNDLSPSDMTLVVSADFFDFGMTSCSTFICTFSTLDLKLATAPFGGLLLLLRWSLLLGRFSGQSRKFFFSAKIHHYITSTYLYFKFKVRVILYL